MRRILSNPFNFYITAMITIVASLIVFTGCDEEDNPAGPTDPDTVVKKDTIRDTVPNTGDTTIVTLTDESINAGETLTLDASKTYIVDGFVFVEDGATLTIPAGTVLKGEPGGGLNASAIIICKGAKIFAEGTAENPVIMTSKADDLDYSDDLGSRSRGLWGGLIVLGKAPTNRAAGTHQIEGIDEADPRGQYGGNDPADNSGVIKYVSIRYGGTNIGEGNEINGLTMGGVGNGTTIEYVEVFNNADDGFEWFGGTVNTKYLLSVGNGDDSYDWDEGFRGKGQYWVVIQDEDLADRAAEMDGSASDNFGNDKYSKPTIYNATFIGSGANSTNAGNMIFKFREETGGFYYNSIFTDFSGDVKTDAGAVTLVGVINFDDDKGVPGNKVTDHVLNNNLELSNNIFYKFNHSASTAEMLVKYSSVAEGVDKTAITTGVSDKNFFGEDPTVTRTKLVPDAGSAPATLAKKEMPAGDTFFDASDYLGAFQPGGADWTSGWSFYSQVK
jgi:hypothetical protein